MSANLTPTDTLFTVSEAPIPESVTLNRSSAFKSAAPLYVVASSGVVSLTRVKLLDEPAVPPTWTKKPLESPAALGESLIRFPAPGSPGRRYRRFIQQLYSR